MDQDATWYRGLSPGNIVLDGDPAPPTKRGTPLLSAHICCAQTAGWIRMPLGTAVVLGLSDIVLDGDSAPPTERVQQPPYFPAHVYCGQTVAHLSNC